MKTILAVYLVVIAVWVWSMCKAAARPLPTAPGSSHRNRRNHRNHQGHRLGKRLALSGAVRRVL